MDAKIIHVDLKPLFCYHIGKDMIHECLECGWSVTEAEEHYSGFKESEGIDEHCLPLIGFMDANVVIPPLDVEFGEESGIFHVIYKFRNKG